MNISAYIPCFNNRASIAAAVASVRAQTRAVDELFVVDDGSTDGSDALVESLGERVIRTGVNSGRGAVRARAMREARHELVLSCDATAALAPDFLERALKWIDAPGTVAVYGRIMDARNATVADRWRARHLFKCDLRPEPSRKAPLITTGALLRKSCAEQCGGYNPDLRHSEDADLGARLLAAGFDVVSDPDLRIAATVSNSLPEVLERYWRWNAGAREEVSPTHYVKQMLYSVKVMAPADLRAGDPAGALVSLMAPHYQFWVSFWRKPGRPSAP